MTMWWNDNDLNNLPVIKGCLGTTEKKGACDLILRPYGQTHTVII